MSDRIRLKTTDINVYCGRKEEGKSTLMKSHAKGLKSRILWDYNHEHGDMGYVVNFTDQIKQALEKGLTHIVFQPFDKSRDAFRQFTQTVNELSQHYSFVLIIEEVERYAKPSNLDLKKHYPNLSALIDTGRHKGIGLWVTCRIVRKLAEDITYNADHIFAFRVHRPQDVDYLEEWIGEKANMLSMVKAQKHGMPFIEKYHYLHFNKIETVVREPV